MKDICLDSGSAGKFTKHSESKGKKDRRAESQVAEAIGYSRGRDKFDANPEQRTAPSFADFADAVLSDRSPAKGLTYVCGPLDRNGDGKHHRCGTGALPRRFLPFDLDDGTTPAGLEVLDSYLSEHTRFSYTTASYTSDKPRMRCIVELSRPVDRAEGVRLGLEIQRKIQAKLVGAGLGLDAVNFDTSVYRAEQPVYTPPTTTTARTCEGKPIDVDAVLKDAPVEEKRTAGVRTHASRLQVEAALSLIDLEDYWTWVRVGMAVKSGRGEDGLESWIKYSSKSSKYDEREAINKWDRGFDADGKITVATLFHEADKRGDWRGVYVTMFEEMIGPVLDRVKAGEHSAVFAPEVLEELVALKRINPGKFEECRANLKKAGCRVKVLDDALNEQRQAGVEGFQVLEATEDERRPGVWHFAPGKPAQWVCSPLYVEAQTLDTHGSNYGRLLRFRTTTGTWREWAMPMELLSGNGDELRRELLGMGMVIDPDARVLFQRYLQSAPDKHVRCATRVGWCGDNFVLPSEVIGPGAGDVIFQARALDQDAYSRGGTMDGWRSEVAALAAGNACLMMMISGSFVGALMRQVSAESGGIHVFNESSTGKTTTLMAACSVWGPQAFMRSWRATANGLEGAAVLSNDGVLILDEIKKAEPKQVGEIVYTISDQQGKQRATREGRARAVTRWACFVLSSGETTLSARMADGGFQSTSGQEVRFLDVPVAGMYGVWNNLHDMPDGVSFTESLKGATGRHYGHAGPAFLERLTRDTRDLPEDLERIKGLPGFHAEGGEGQHYRAAERFALVALAGELATEYGITGWEKGAAIAATIECFKAWVGRRDSGARNSESQKILDQVAGFIARHGNSRFGPVCADQDPKNKIYDQAGWFMDDPESKEVVYLFHADGMHEALKGFDFRRGLDALGQQAPWGPILKGRAHNRGTSVGRSVESTKSTQTSWWPLGRGKRWCATPGWRI